MNSTEEKSLNMTIRTVTIKDKMDKQTIFNQVLTGMRAQGCLGSKAYLDDQGKKCAIGILIPDNLYSKEFEDYVPAQVLARIGYAVPDDIQFDDRWFLSYIQNYHDGSKSLDDFEFFMKLTAKKYGLNYESPANL